MNPQDLKDYIVRPTLKAIKEFIPYSLAGERLVLGTAAQESHLYYLDQTTPGPGPAYGIYQMEWATHQYHVSWLKEKPLFYQLVDQFQIRHLDNCDEMHGNLYYATIMCRVHYWRCPQKLPLANDIPGLANYWKKYYNTYLGSGTVEEFIRNYNLLIKGLK